MGNSRKRTKKTTTRARRMRVKKFRDRRVRLESVISNMLNTGSQPSSSHVEIKQEPLEIQHEESIPIHSFLKLVQPEIFAALNPNGTSTKDEKVYRCLICYGVTSEPGVTVKVDEIFKKNPDEGDFVVTFLLRKILQVPVNKMAEYLSLFGQPKEWVTACKSCEAAISEGFHYQKVIEHMEMKQKALQKRLVDKIKGSWQGSAENKSVLKPLDNAYLDPVSNDVRCYLATGTWQEIKGVPKKRRLKSKMAAGSLSGAMNSKLKEESDKRISSVYSGEEAYGEDIPFVEDYGDGLEGGVNSEMDKATNLDIPGVCNSINVTAADIEAENQRLYNCKLCEDLKPMKLNAFVQHIHYHKLRPCKCRICGTYYTQAHGELAAQPAKDPTLITSSNHPVPPHDHKCTAESLDLVEFRTGPVWKCSLCPDRFESHELRDSHKESHGLQASDENPPRFTCSLCEDPVNLSSYAEWRIHRAVSHSHHSSLACLYCDKTFKLEMVGHMDSDLDRKGLFQHLKKFHKKLPNPGIGLVVYPECEFCGANFVKPETAVAHVEKAHGVTGGDAFLCYFCNKRKPTPSSLRNHQYVHMKRNRDKKKKFMCETCGKVSDKQIMITEHMFTQHGISPLRGKLYPCPQKDCQFQTTINAKVRFHLMKEHGFERTHKCSICGKGFLNSSKLREHERTHNTEKPYQCEICGNSFALKNYLYIHTRLSHANRPFASTHKKKPYKKKIKKIPTTTATATNIKAPEIHNPVTNSHIIQDLPILLPKTGADTHVTD